MIDKLRNFIRPQKQAPDEKDLYPHLFSSTANPKVTVGYIVLWAILKTAIVLPASWFILEYYRLLHYWWFPLVAIFFIAIYPAVRQYERYRNDSRKIEENSLCATCRHFDATGIVCMLYDEHVSTTHIPCEGTEWEAKRP